MLDVKLASMIKKTPLYQHEHALCPSLKVQRGNCILPPCGLFVSCTEPALLLGQPGWVFKPSAAQLQPPFHGPSRDADAFRNRGPAAALNQAGRSCVCRSI